MKAKRILASFIAMAMTMGMMSSLVLADESENAPEETSVVETTEPKEKETKKPEEKKPAETKEAYPEPEKKPDETVKETEPSETTETEPAQPSEKEPAESKEEETSKPTETEPKQSSVPTEEKEPGATVAPEHGGKSDTHSVPPKNEQTSTEEISSVTITIDKPLVGEKPDYTAGFPTDANYYSEAFGNEYYENNIRWLDVTNNSFMSKDSAVFEWKHEYQIVLFLTAKDGYSFSGSTTATVNGNIAKTSIDEEGHLRVSYNFPMLKKAIYYVSVSLDNPIIGSKPDYTAGFPTDANYYSEAFSNEYYENYIRWLDVTNNSFMSKDSAVFEWKHEYQVVLFLTAKDGYFFSESSTATVNENVAKTSIDEEGHLRIVYNFPMLRKKIDSVSVGLDAPVVGAKPDYEAVFPSDANYYTLVYNEEEFCNGIGWQDVKTGYLNPNSGVFTVGHQYQVEVYLTARDGYYFDDSTTAVLNGQTNVWHKPRGGGSTMYITYTFVTLEGEVTDSIPSVDITINVPVVGAKPDYEAVFPSGANYYSDDFKSGDGCNDIFWADLNSDDAAFVNPDKGVFEAGHQYKVIIYLSAKAGYRFSTDTTAKLNGETIEPQIVHGQLVITYLYPPLEGYTTMVDGNIYTITSNNSDGTGTVTLTGAYQRASVSIPATVVISGYVYKVTRIGAKAFYGDKTIKTLSIGANVAIIDGSAFYGCSNLTTVSGGKGLKTIGSSAFAKCSKLKSFSIASSVLSKIGTYAFNKDSKLKTISIKNTTKLTKSGVKKSLKGSKVKTVKVKKSKVKKYKKYFKKKNSGRSVKVKK